MSSRDNGSPPRGKRSQSFTPGPRAQRSPAGGARPIGGGGLMEPMSLEPEALEELEELEDLGADALSDPDDGPAFVVLVEGAPPRWFVANADDLTIGRGGEADIPVGHKTVSRQRNHARVNGATSFGLKVIKSPNPAEAIAATSQTKLLCELFHFRIEGRHNTGSGTQVCVFAEVALVVFERCDRGKSQRFVNIPVQLETATGIFNSQRCASVIVASPGIAIGVTIAKAITPRTSPV